ncbi:hypothetical protein HGRIS_004006 [Hohenbuehelia grisea]|uniref:Uncharacterized protein n=1 Tax=Hohenbuehelia grisea TaxID=104357 RepID=A0ABR3JHT4_9AGAR
MAPGIPAKHIKIKVPRHNSQRLGAKLTASVKAAADDEGDLVQTYQPNIDSNMAQAIENASDWNSLLLTARAERGPQWDVGTQQFHVEEFSELYYDSTSLQEAVRKQDEEENGVPESKSSGMDRQTPQPGPGHHGQREFTPHHLPLDPNVTPQHMRHGTPGNFGYGAGGGMGNSPLRGPFPGGGPGMGGNMGMPGMAMGGGGMGGGGMGGGMGSAPGSVGQFSPMPANQFYPGHEGGSPMRMGMDPGHGRHPMMHGGMVGGMGGMPGGHGMQAMNISPDIRQRMVRMDEFSMN